MDCVNYFLRSFSKVKRVVQTPQRTEPSSPCPGDKSAKAGQVRDSEGLAFCLPSRGRWDIIAVSPNLESGCWMDEQ